jgi:hypothetical protein
MPCACVSFSVPPPPRATSERRSLLDRFALGHAGGATLAMLHQAVAAFERLPDDPEAPHRELVALIRR